MTWIELTFWGPAAFALLVMGVYPLGLVALARRARRGTRRTTPGQAAVGEPPRICVVLSAFGRPAQLLDRLRQAAAIDYPTDRIEFLILCAADDDLSADIARTLSHRHATVIRLADRADRRTGLAAALERTACDYVLSFDADWALPVESLPRLIARSRDERVGCVFGRLVASGQAEDGPFEVWRRRLDVAESDLGMFMPIEPTVWIARRAVCRQALVDGRILPAELAAAARRERLRAVYEPDAIVLKRFAPAGPGGFELWRRNGEALARTVRESPSLRRPIDRAVLGFWIRRGLTWLAPIALGTAFVANVELSSDPWYLRALLVHELAYVVAVVALLSAHASRFRWWRNRGRPQGA